MSADDFHPETVTALLYAESSRLYNERSAEGWSTQGFGMARLYLGSNDVRLNIWHSSLAVDGLTPDTGMIHTHPWDFTSRIVAGELTNQRYQWRDEGAADWRASATHPWCCAEITPGPGGNFTDAEGRATLPSGHTTRRFGTLVKKYGPGRAVMEAPEVYGPGDTYAQTYDEIHHTSYRDGTVTLNRRVRNGRPDRAFTFWRADRQWVSAEPRDGDRARLLVAIDAAIALLGADR